MPKQSFSSLICERKQNTLDFILTLPIPILAHITFPCPFYQPLWIQRQGSMHVPPGTSEADAFETQWMFNIWKWVFWATGMKSIMDDHYKWCDQEWMTISKKNKLFLKLQRKPSFSCSAPKRRHALLFRLLFFFFSGCEISQLRTLTVTMGLRKPLLSSCWAFMSKNFISCKNAWEILEGH